jgi:hypothetical protein
MKLLGHRPGLPGNVTSLYIAPLDTVHSAGLAGHVPAKRTILFFARRYSRYRFLAGSTGWDVDPTMSEQRIPPCLPAPVPTEGGAGRYKIFSGIPDEF